MEQIDAHHHFWDPARGDYGWMSPDDAVLSRPYGPGDLAPHLARTGVSRTVLVQAAPTVAETEYLLKIADAAPHVAGVVGWVDFTAPDVGAVMDRLNRHPKLIGLRPMIQDIPDPEWMLRRDVARAFDALEERGLRFDLLGFPQHLAPGLKLLEQRPDMAVVLDHCMKPRIGVAEAFAPWAEGMTRIAQNTGACCKLSGLVTEAPGAVSAEDLRPYAEHVIDTFGAERVMWGSDWPVARLRCEYADWHAMARELTSGLDAAAQGMIFGGNARRFYGLGDEGD